MEHTRKTVNNFKTYHNDRSFLRLLPQELRVCNIFWTLTLYIGNIGNTDWPIYIQAMLVSKTFSFWQIN